MTTTTITLERSAYELLKARKKPDESFSEEVHRIMGDPRPSLKGFLDLFPIKDGRAIGDAIEAVRREDLAEERKRLGRGRKELGARA